MSRKATLAMALGYAIFVASCVVVLVHEPTRFVVTTARGTDEAPTDPITLEGQHRDQHLRAERLGAEKRAGYLFLVALPWVLLFDPSGGHLWLYFVALLLNVATAYGFVSWMFPPSRHLPK